MGRRIRTRERQYKLAYLNAVRTARKRELTRDSHGRFGLARQTWVPTWRKLRQRIPQGTGKLFDAHAKAGEAALPSWLRQRSRQKVHGANLSLL